MFVPDACHRLWYVSPTLSTVDGTIGWLESQGRAGSLGRDRRL